MFPNALGNTVKKWKSDTVQRIGKWILVIFDQFHDIWHVITSAFSSFQMDSRWAVTDSVNRNKTQWFPWSFVQKRTEDLENS